MADESSSATNQDKEYTPKVGWTASETTISVYFFLFLSLLALAFVLCSKLHNSRLSKFLPEAGLIILVGIFAGAFFSLIETQTDENESSDEVDINYNDDNYNDGEAIDYDEASDAVIEGLLSFSSKGWFYDFYLFL